MAAADMANVLAQIPEVMTNRARVLLAGTGVFFTGLAFFLVFKPLTWLSPSYGSLKIMPLWVWGGVMFLVAGALFASGLTRNRHVARLSLCVSATITGVWSFSFFAAYLVGTLAGPSGPISWSFITFVLLVQVKQPLRVPLEEVVQRASSRAPER